MTNHLPQPIAPGVFDLAPAYKVREIGSSQKCKSLLSHSLGKTEGYQLYDGFQDDDSIRFISLSLSIMKKLNSAFRPEILLNL